MEAAPHERWDEQKKAINNLSLRKNIIIQKAPKKSSTKHLCTSCAQNDELEAALSHRSPHREVQSIKERDINMWCIKSLLLTVLNVSYCARKEPFIVLSTTVLWSNRHLVESNKGYYIYM